MRPINLYIIKRTQFSKIMEESWTSCNSIKEVSDEMQKIQGNIEEITVDYWVKECEYNND